MKSAVPLILFILLVIVVLIAALAVYSNNEASRIVQIRDDTKAALQQYCTDRKLIETDCAVWAHSKTSDLSAAGLAWASSCTKNNPSNQQVLFCIEYANDLR